MVLHRRARVDTNTAIWTTMKFLSQMFPHVVNDSADHIAQFKTEGRGSAALTAMWIE